MIKKRNLDPSLLQWIMAETGLGPGIGELFYVAPATSSTSQFRTQLESMGVSDISLLPSTAEAKMVAYRNDVMLVAPGAYAETAEIAWDKPWSHIIGMGGNNIGGDYSEPNVVIYTATANVTQTINVTGQNSRFANFVVENNYSDADNLAAALINIYGTHWRNVAFHGHMAATQNTTAAAASLYIGGNGMYPLLEDCIIGQDVWGTRSGANSGVLRFSASTGRPNGGIFRRCQFLSRSITAACALVALPAAQCTGRSWLYDDCHFSNFYDEVTLLTQVFYTVTGTQKFTHQLRHCTVAGFTEWQTGDFDVVVADMPITGTGGGLMKAPTGTVGN